MDGVFEASEEFGVRRVAQCGGQLVDGCGVVVLLVSICVRRVLGHSFGGVLWPRVSRVGVAGGCGVGYPVVHVRAMECGWCSAVWHACPRVRCRMCSCVTPV